MDKCVILAVIALIHSVTAVMNLTTLQRTAPRFLPQKCHVTKTDLIQSMDIPIPQGTDHNPPTMVTDMVDISIKHNPLPFKPRQEQQFQKAHIMLLIQPPQQLMPPLADGCPHCHLCNDTSNWHSHTPSHTHHFAHRCPSCYYSTGPSKSCSSNPNHTAQEIQPRKAKSPLRPSTPHEAHHSKTVIIQDSPLNSSSDSDNDSDP